MNIEKTKLQAIGEATTGILAINILELTQILDIITAFLQVTIAVITIFILSKKLRQFLKNDK